METDDGQREAMEKNLAKLQWLIGRTKPDFKGNTPAFVKHKTKKSVEESLKQAERALGNRDMFRPFWHTTVPLAMDATRVKHVDVASPEVETTQLGDTHHTRNPYKQVLDKATGKPEVYSVMEFDGSFKPEAVRGKKRFPACSSLSADEGRPTLRDITGADPKRKYQMIRKEIWDHPKFSSTSRVERPERLWNATTQLPHNAIVDPLPKRPIELVPKRNSIRMVSIMRRTHTPSNWK